MIANESPTPRGNMPTGIAERDDLMQTLLNTADWIIFSVDTEFRYTSFNALHAQVMKELFGADLALGYSIDEYLPPERAAAIKAQLTRGMQERYTITVQNKGETTRYFDATYYPMHDSAGVSTGVLIVTRDVTEREQADAEIRNARDFYLRLLDDFPALIWRSRADGTCDYVNNAWLLYTEQTLERALGTGWAASIHPDDAERALQSFLTALAARQPVEIEYRLRHHSGEYRWILDTGRPFYDPDGTFAGYIGMCFDVHDLKQTVSRLDGLRSVDKAILWGRSVDEIATTSLHHLRRLLHCERATFATFDFATQIMTFQAVDAEYATEIRPGQTYPIEGISIDVLRKGETRAIADLEQLPIYHPIMQQLRDEGLRSLLSVPLLAEDELMGIFNMASSQPGYFTPALEEIAREVATPLALALHQAKLREKIRRHTEELETLVAERTAELQAFFKLPQVGMALTALDRRWLMVNDELCRMFGYSRDELMQLTWDAITHPDDIDASTTEFKQLISGSIDSYSLDKRYIHKDGSVVETLVTVRCLRDAQGNASRLVSLIQDISERKKAERAIQAALQREQELNELKSRFVAMVSHEYRTPLAIIQVTLDTLEQYQAQLSEAQVRDSFAKMHRQIELMSLLVEDVLTVDGLQSNKVHFRPERVNLHQFCTEMVAVVALTQHAHERIHYRGSDVSSSVDLDRTLMQLVLTNLLTNALKYSPASTPVELDVTFQENCVTMRVTDHGIGVPSGDIPRLFEPLHRAANVGTVSGTGLGLTIAKYAVELHGGTITCDSPPGIGSVFTVTIPATQDVASSY